uniref:Uncharacterized protein n=1 Tax=Rhizophora mucronata TaxID=61149 RepID=A0A2P2PAG4_RHIMU
MFLNVCNLCLVA